MRHSFRIDCANIFESCPLFSPLLRRFIKIVRNVLIVIILLTVVGFWAIRQPVVQTWLTQRVAAYLSKELGTKVTLSRVEVNLWSRLVIENLYVEDLRKDTLAFIPKLTLGTYSIEKGSGKLIVNGATLESPYFNLEKHAGDSLFNYKFILSYIDSFSNPADTSHSELSFSDISINNGRFGYTDENKPLRDRFGVDWTHMQYSDINLKVSSLYQYADSIHAEIENLSTREKSGIHLTNLSGTFINTSTSMSLLDACLQTEETDLNGSFRFQFETIDDFDFFEERVKLNAIFYPSTIQLGDISYFSSDLKGIDKLIDLSGKFRGKISDLRGRDVKLKIDENTRFIGDFDASGLPELDQTFISMDIEELTSNKTELDRLPLPPFDSLHFVKTPNNFAELGQMTFRGNFTGFINDFVSDGILRTAIGSVKTDLALREDKSINDYRYQGSLGTDNFDLGKFYSSSSLGPLSCDLTVAGTSLDIEKIDANFEGNINNIYIEGYNYVNLTADGTFKRRYFNGDFHVDDPNVVMDFKGFIDLTKAEPVLGFDADVAQLNLRELKILETYDYNSISGRVRANSVGFELEKFIGTIELDEISYCSGDNEYYLEHLRLSSERKGEPLITLDSDIVRARIEGDFTVKDIGNSFLEITSKIIPHFNPPYKGHNPQDFTMKIDILDFSQISEVFIPELKVAQNTTINIVLDEPESFFELVVVSDSISYAGNKLTSVVLDARRPDNSLYLTVMSDRFKAANAIDFRNFAIDARTDADTVYSAMAWGDLNTTHRGDVNGKLTINSFEDYEFVFGRSSVTVKNEPWEFKEGSYMSYRNNEFEASNFEITNVDQFIKANGVISHDPEKIMYFELNEFDLAFLNEFISDIPKLSGRVLGNATVKDVYGQMIFANDLILRDLKLNEYDVGYLCVKSIWDNIDKRLRIDGTLEKDVLISEQLTRLTPLRFSGYYNPRNAESPLDVVATVSDLDLAFINEFMSPGILAINGLATGTIALTGKLDAPQMNGIAMLRQASVFVYYLNTRYFIEQNIGIMPDMFTFDYIKIRDQEGNPGYLTGQIAHTNFGRWVYDIFIDIDKPMLAMNTNEELNSLYYGKAYTTGTASIYGYDGSIEFDCNLRSERGTVLAMPMGSTSEQAMENFVRFIDKDKDTKEEPLDLSGIKLNFDLEITQDAEMQIIFDQSVGDVMKGRGQGHINMNINNLSTFSMYGQVELVKGDYLFTLKNLVNKEFKIKPGGTISWYGDPFAGDLNLFAYYQVPASLYDILPDPNYQSGQRVPVDLVMHLTGKMFNPTIAFDIELPTVDNVTRSRVNAVVSTDQEKNRQAFALLVLRRFVSPPNVNSEHSGGNALAAHSSELLSSQVSNWLSQISNEFNLGFNYRPGDDISNEEIALALSTQLFNDRMSIASNVGVSRNTSSVVSNTSNLIGDIRIEYKLTPEGKVRLVVYNESNDFRLATTQQSPYTQGLGVLYREEFDTMDEFWASFKDMLTSDKKKDTP